MSEPRVITETVVRKWKAVGPPVDCCCGHQHYPRVWGNFAPQWGFCEAECGCNTLHPSKYGHHAPSTAPLTPEQPAADHGDGSGAGGREEGEGA